MIPVHYKYKNYGKLALRATAYSRALGIFTSLVAMVMWGFLWAALWGFVLCNWLEEGVAYGIAFVSLIPFYWLLLRLKKRLVAKIDRLAQRELQAKSVQVSLCGRAAFRKKRQAQRP